MQILQQDEKIRFHDYQDMRKLLQHTSQISQIYFILDFIKHKPNLNLPGVDIGLQLIFDGQKHTGKHAASLIEHYLIPIFEKLPPLP